MCNLSFALSNLLKSMFISLLLVMAWHWFCSNYYAIVFITKKKNTVNVLKISIHCFLFLQNAYTCSCSPRTYVVEVVTEHLYIAMMDSLRQQFYPRMRQTGRDRKISDIHRKGVSCPMCEIADKDFHQQCPLSRSNNRNNLKMTEREREYQCGIRTLDFQAQKRSYRFSVLSPGLTWISECYNSAISANTFTRTAFCTN